MGAVAALHGKVKTVRTLPPEEWHRLAGTELGSVIHLLPPTAHVVVVEQDGVIIGCWSLTPLWHAEGVWIHPDHRQSPGVAMRLLRWLYATAKAEGASAVLTGSLSATVSGYLERLGGTVTPGQTYVLPVKD